MTNREQQLEQSWTANATAWTQAVRGGHIESRVLATNEAVVSAVLEQHPRRVLDVGCGEGWLSHRLAESDVDVAGFDSTAELIRRAADAGIGTFKHLDYASFASNPGLVGSGFDVAVCNFSLLGREIVPVLRGCAEVLRSHGVLVIQTVHPFTVLAESGYEDGWREEDFSSMRLASGARMPWYFRTVGSWIGELLRSGFALQACREPIHPQTHRPLSLLLVGRKSNRT